ncbi:MAG TPA: c-type cytochrome [Terriglobales bacterium]|nr:c-type cytochrome [Terriglobales bacterium]
MRILKIGATAAALAVALGLAWGIWNISSHGFSAREKPAAYEVFLARHARRLASEPGATKLKNPIEATPLAIAEARDHFADHCAICHGNRGDGKTQINAGLYPPAPDMRTPDTQELSDGELFYIIKNGIRFTGMPGWGGSDEDNWKLVLFIRHLPELTPLELKFMTEVNHMPVESEAGH